MRCEDCREALSAAIDGEDAGVPVASVEDHLGGCPACRAWREAAIGVTRSARLSVVRDAPDLTVPLLTALGSARHRRSPWTGRCGWLRLALAATGLLLALASVQGVLVEHATMHADHHPIHELGSFEVALASGFAFAAWRPSRAWGMLPLAALVVGLVTVNASLDLLAGRTDVSAEVGHVFELCGLGLMWRLSREGMGAPRTALRHA